VSGMFSVTEVPTSKGLLQYREEQLTGFRCRISPERLKRHIDQELYINPDRNECPFCPENIFSVTPTFSDGKRIIRGESVTFPNLYPFGEWHVVTVITKEHFVENFFSPRQIIDALSGQAEALLRVEGYPSINWNFLPSAGASLVHPHLQGISDQRPSLITERYISVSRKYLMDHGKKYWDVVREEERTSARYLFGEEILWSAHAVPLGEREVRAILPISSLDEFGSYIDLLVDGILKVLSLYQKLGTHAFNMAIFFDKTGQDNGFCAFCSLISRINPNPSSTNDSAFMERLHMEPVILTMPEELGTYFRAEFR
jgi:galactose-1-phosphate uridylyltransferase